MVRYRGGPGRGYGGYGGPGRGYGGYGGRIEKYENGKGMRI